MPASLLPSLSAQTGLRTGALLLLLGLGTLPTYAQRPAPAKADVYIDGKGIIRYQHIGEIRREHVPVILQKLKEAQ